MGLLRSTLLAASHSTWLRRHVVRRRFVRRAVRRFMPGETPDEALAAARELAGHGLGSILTHLGENLASRAEADAVLAHYLDLAGRIRAAGLDAEISVKLTQLGLDLDPSLAAAHLARIAGAAQVPGRHVWIDMESSAYVDRTLALWREVHAAHPHVGVCLQAYLRRTPADLEALLPLGPAIRLVKGAYQEPAHVAYPHKHDVDEAFFAMAERLLAPEARAAGAWPTVGTHDRALIARVSARAASLGVPKDGLEFALLYGIQSGEALRLAGEGWRVRVLISYGEAWFPWYMRRLAERPANLAFVLRSLGRR